MVRKFLVGMALVAILGAVGASGYQFGKFLKERERLFGRARTRIFFKMAEDLRHNRRNSCRRSAASYG